MMVAVQDCFFCFFAGDIHHLQLKVMMDRAWIACFGVSCNLSHREADSCLLKYMTGKKRDLLESHFSTVCTSTIVGSRPAIATGITTRPLAPL